MNLSSDEFGFHLVGICLPGVLFALVALGIYLKERSRKL